MVTGQCLCGRVTLTTTHPVTDISVCHCGMCRKWNGGPFFTTECGSNVTITGEEFITRYASSEWAERAFCRECGTHLFYALKTGGAYYVSAGLFGDNAGNRLTMQVYTDCKPAYYNFAEKTTMLTEQDIMAMFTGK